MLRLYCYTSKQTNKQTIRQGKERKEKWNQRYKKKNDWKLMEKRDSIKKKMKWNVNE